MKPAIMTPDELREIQRAMGWSNGDLADTLGVTVSTVVKWRGGQHPIPRPSVIAIRALRILSENGIQVAGAKVRVTG